MYKLVILSAIVAAVSAGYLAGPYGHAAPYVVAAHAPLAVAHAPVAVAAPVAVKTAVPVATSYQNSNSISVGATPVVAAHAPVAVAHAPVAVAHAAPVVVSHGYGYGGHGFYH